MARVMMWVMRRYVYVVAWTAGAMIVADLAIYIPAMLLGWVDPHGNDALSAGIYAVNFISVVIFLLTPSAMALWTRWGVRARVKYRSTRANVLAETISRWHEDRVSTLPRDSDDGIAAAVSTLRVSGVRKDVAWLSSPSQASPLATMSGELSSWASETLLDYIRVMSIRGKFPESDAAAIRRSRGIASLHESVASWANRAAESESPALPLTTLAAQADYLVALTGDSTLEVSRVIALVRSSSLMMETEDEVLIIDSPVSLVSDDRGAIHCADAPAIVWADGSEMWGWGGVVMPEALVRGSLPPELVLSERSPLVRHAAMEAAGFERFLHLPVFEEVSSCPDPGNPGQELRLLRFSDESMRSMGQKVLVCINGTVEKGGARKTYALTVPVTMSDPVKAAAWTYGMTKKEYARAVRRA